jgi:hypothetical protein
MRYIKSLAAIAALSFLPLSFAPQACAQGYYDRLEHDNERIAHDNYRIQRERQDIWRDRQRLGHERAERDYYRWREYNAARHGDYWDAQHYRWRWHHEQREIDALHRDIGRDRDALWRYRYRRDADVDRRNYDAYRY